MRRAYNNRLFVVQNNGVEKVVTTLLVAKWSLVVIGFGLIAYLAR